MHIFFILIGFLGFVSGLLYLVFNSVKRKDKKTSIVIIVASILIIILGLILGFNGY